MGCFQSAEIERRVSSDSYRKLRAGEGKCKSKAKYVYNEEPSDVKILACKVLK